jgi:hypothetical protein
MVQTRKKKNNKKTRQRRKRGTNRGGMLRRVQENLVRPVRTALNSTSSSAAALSHHGSRISNMNIQNMNPNTNTSQLLQSQLLQSQLLPLQHVTDTFTNIKKSILRDTDLLVPNHNLVDVEIMNESNIANKLRVYKNEVISMNPSYTSQYHPVKITYQDSNGNKTNMMINIKIWNPNKGNDSDTEQLNTFVYDKYATKYGLGSKVKLFFMNKKDELENIQETTRESLTLLADGASVLDVFDFFNQRTREQNYTFRKIQNLFSYLLALLVIVSVIDKPQEKPTDRSTITHEPHQPITHEHLCRLQTNINSIDMKNIDTVEDQKETKATDIETIKSNIETIKTKVITQISRLIGFIPCLKIPQN